MNRRSYRRRMKKKRRVKRIKFYALTIALVVLGVFVFKFIDKNKDINEAASMKNLSKEELKALEKIVAPKEENKDLGAIESIIEYGDNGLIGAHYPLFSKENIDKTNKELVNKYIKEFQNELKNDSFRDKDYRYELSIDYESYSGPDNIISIKYIIVKNSSYLAHPDEVIVTKVYDLNKDSEVKLDDIMTDEYLKFISHKSEKYFNEDKTYKEQTDSEQFKEAISPLSDNYSNFLLKEDRIVFFFPKYTLFSGDLGETSVEIAYGELKEHIKPKLLPIFTELENTSVKNENKEVVDIVIPKRNIDPTKPMIALTFDDGPNKKVTLPILDVLKEYESAATFFILGNRVSDNKDVLKRILEEGSEIGNHSYNHKQLTKVSSTELTKQIKDTQNAVIDATGIEPKIMRPTYGSYDENLKAKVGMPLILWSIDTLDWKSRDAKKVTDHVLENIKDGDIVLMHDIYESTAEAAEVLVEKLTAMGYQLVTVSELIENRGESLKDGEIYNQAYKKDI